MFKELIQFYKIGTEMGLNRKEINRIFLAEGKHSAIFILLIIFGAIATGVAIILAIIFASSKANVYPAGALYSTVRSKDFKKK